MTNVNLSSFFNFELGPFVHRRSWGQRRKATNSESLWSSNHFTLEESLGHGHFGCVYRATHHYRNEKTGGGGGGGKHGKQIVALKTFSKQEILLQLEHGGRSLELLQREVNIHSW